VPGPRIALATCADHPALDDDDRLLLPALARRGATGVPAVWDDPAVDWAAVDGVVLRETWDYPERVDAFLAWLDTIPVPVLNPPALVRWNADKSYLGELADAGIPTVPTSYLHPGADPAAAGLPTAGQVVVKPTVSAGSRDTARYDAAVDADAVVAHVRRLLDAGRAVMVQPYVASVDARGETAVLHLGGTSSHAIAKGPLLTLGAPPTDRLFAAEAITARTPTDAERALADAVLAAVPRDLGDPVYARVDLVEGSDGPLLLELELIEPSLFLSADPEAADRLAAAVLERFGST
jgi:hypothetical protein